MSKPNRPRPPRTKETDAVAYLVQRGWSEVAASGIVAHLDLSSPRTMIPPSRWGLFHDYASATERNKDYATSALAFIDTELRNSFQALGAELQKASGANSAYAAAAPYWGRSGARFLSLSEAKASGYTDAGNKELNKGDENATSS